jgi:hypothetical protein
MCSSKLLSEFHVPLSIMRYYSLLRFPFTDAARRSFIGADRRRRLALAGRLAPAGVVA